MSITFIKLAITLVRIAIICFDKFSVVSENNGDPDLLAPLFQFYFIV